MRSAQLLCVCYLFVTALAGECGGDQQPSCVADLDAAAIMQTNLNIHDNLKASDKVEDGVEEGVASIMKVLQIEQKKVLQIEQKLELLQDQLVHRSSSQVEHSLLNDVNLTSVMEEHQQLLSIRKETHKKALTTKEPFYVGASFPSDTEAFENLIAAGGANAFTSLRNDGGVNWRPIADLGFRAVAMVNPVVGFFCIFFMSLLGGDPNEALIDHIMKQVDKKINSHVNRVLSNQLTDLTEELQWVPGMLTEADAGAAGVTLSYWLLVQHDIATKKSLVFHEDCIAQKPWEAISAATLSGPEGVGQALVQEASGTKAGGGALLQLEDIHGFSDTGLCEEWLKEGRNLELMWGFAEFQLNVLTQITLVKPAFKDLVAQRISEISHQYAGLLKNAYEKHVAYRAGLLKKKMYCPASFGSVGGCRTGRKWGVRDDYLNKDVRNKDFNAYVAMEKGKMSITGLNRIAKMLCFHQAATQVTPEYKYSEGEDCEHVTSSSECESAATALGCDDKSAKDDNQKGWSVDPPYCYYEGGSLKYNRVANEKYYSEGTNTGKCTKSDKCLCRKALTWCVWDANSLA